MILVKILEKTKDLCNSYTPDPFTNLVNFIYGETGDLPQNLETIKRKHSAEQPLSGPETQSRTENSLDIASNQAGSLN